VNSTANAYYGFARSNGTAVANGNWSNATANSRANAFWNNSTSNARAIDNRPTYQTYPVYPTTYQNW
jgi:hypothetical protein